MTTYVAYIAVNTQQGDQGVVTAAAPTVGVAIRNAAAKLNAAVAASGGYTGDTEGLRALTVVFGVGPEIKEVRHEIKDGQLTVYPVTEAGDESRDPAALDAALVMFINPLKADESQFLR